MEWYGYLHMEDLDCRKEAITKYLNQLISEKNIESPVVSNSQEESKNDDKAKNISNIMDNFEKIKGLAKKAGISEGKTYNSRGQRVK